MPARSFLSQLDQDDRLWLEKELIRRGFGDYTEVTEALNERLAQKGQELKVSRSSLHRYGSALEERTEMLRAATQGAIAMRQSLGDDEAAVAEMSLQMAQGLLFNLMIERGEDLAPKEITLITRALSDASRAGIGVKKYQQELKAKTEAAFETLEKQGTGIDLETLRRVREEIYGLF